VKRKTDKEKDLLKDTTTQSNSGHPAQPGKTTKNPHHADIASSMEIRDPDAFQETVLGGWQWVEEHAATVGALVAIGLIVLTGYVVKNWWHGRSERKAQEAYYAVEAKFVKIKDGFERAKMQGMIPQSETKDAKNQLKDQLASGDIEKDYGPVMADLEKMARENSTFAAGAQAAILASQTFLTYGKLDQAITIAESVAKNNPPTSMLGALVHVQWGSALAAKNDCAQAVKVWEQVAATPSAKYLLADLSLRSGVCFEQMGQTDKALEMYRKSIAEAGPESPLATTAKGLSRALEIKASAPVAAAVAPATPKK
jgi:tetratricopeptide (TPR) repeat protein